MEPAEKRAKLDDGESSAISTRETEILDMNDDCISEILELLELDDLYSFGSTCVRINQLAGDLFERKHSDEWINISIKSKPKKLIVFEHSNQYVQSFFGKYFRSIKIGPSNRIIGQTRIFQFIETMCCPNLKHLQINRLYGKLSPKHGELIQNQLNHLESIKINDFRVDDDIYAGLLQHCKRIKSFSIHTDRDANADWMIQSYPMLEHLEIYFADKRHRVKFNRIFQQFRRENPQLNGVTCFQADVLVSVISSVTYLPYLKVQFEKDNDVFKAFNHLKKACNEGVIGGLELTMPKWWLNHRGFEYDMNAFADLPLFALRNIQLNNVNNILSMPRMVYLRELNLSLQCAEEELIEILRIFSQLPELVELDLKYQFFFEPPIIRLFDFRFDDLFLPFVQNSTKMTILKVNAPNVFDTGSWDLSQVTRLNSVRSLVRDAAPMIIYIRAEKTQYLEYNAMLHRIPVGKMVKIHLEMIVPENIHRRRHRLHR